MKVRDFNLAQTLECGQCFNFEKIDENEYIVVAFGKMLHVKQKGDELLFLNSAESDIKNIWADYFDLSRDYSHIKNEIIKADKRLDPIVSQYYGIHILNQDFTETLFSFIISQNKNITQIKQLVRRLSEEKGNYIDSFSGRKYYSFPDLNGLNELSAEDFKALKTGFRAPYLRDAADKLVSGEITERSLRLMEYEQAREKLKIIKGVGDKVANCVLLFSLGFRAAFPVDVWIKRIVDEMYDGDVKKAADTFRQYGGYAQQYLFMYARENL